MSANRAIFVDHSNSEHFVVREVPAPAPQRDEAVVLVKAASINRGEVRRSMSAPAGTRPGWDFAGVVEQPAADGSGPKAGTRVVGMLSTGSWAERIAAPVNSMAELPESVSFTDAATLPVAGLTALHSLYKGGFLLNRNVLITGATGGVGNFTCQLALLGGAIVTAAVRNPNRAKVVQSLGVQYVVAGDDPSEAAKFGPYSLIIDSVAGPHFGKLLAMLASDGTCVIFGATGGAEPVINASKFYATGGAKLIGFILFHELRREPASVGLKILGDLVARKKLQPHVEVEDSWKNIGKLAKQLIDRKYTGKAIMKFD